MSQKEIKKNREQEERRGMSYGGALAVSVLLILVCTVTVIFQEGIAEKVGLFFTILVVGSLGMYLVWFILRTLYRLLTHRGRSVTLQKIDEMDGAQFESFCAGLLLRMGYTGIEMTGKSADQGTDITARKDDLSYAVQCKRYDGHVGNKAVQEAYAGKTHYGCDVAVVMTNSYFTPAAVKLAESTGVLLWDREFLMANEDCFPGR